MYNIMQGLRIERTPDRKTRAVLQKVARRFEQLTTQVACNEAQIQSLQSQLEDLKGPKRRKRVAVDPNTKFANVDSIKEAIDQVEEEAARVKAKETNPRPQRVSARKAKANISKSMYTEVINLD
jgi:uncharacterized protein YoxC